MALMMGFMYALLVDSAGVQEQQVSCYGHITTYSIHRIDVVSDDTKVIHLNIPTTIPSNACRSSYIIIIILAGDFLNHQMTLIMLMQLHKKPLFAWNSYFLNRQVISLEHENRLSFSKPY